MSGSERVAFIVSQTACMMAELEGMKAENAFRERRGEAMAYGADAFDGLASAFGLDRNAVISFFQGKS